MSNLPSIQELLARRRGVSSAEGASAQPRPQQTQETPQRGVSTSVNHKSTSFHEQPDAAEELQKKMADILKKDREQEASQQARALGVAAIDLVGFPITSDALRLIPEAQARELGAVVFLFTGSELRLAALHPDKPQIQDLLFQLTERHKVHGKIYLMSEGSFAQAMKLYDALPKIIAPVKGVEITAEDLTRAQEQMQGGMTRVAELLTSTNVTDILTVIIAAAIFFHSSDVHIEAEDVGIIVRLRIDGMLQEIARIDREQWKKIINRIKLIASLKMNITNQAQDGRFTIFQHHQKIDVRVSAIPTAYGESVVMRLLTPDAIALSFDALGFRPAVLKKLLHEVERPNGMIVTTGPTGSGKTTTLYAILRKLNTPDVKIITLEDPIEYKLEGINQSQIDAQKEYTFAKGLRSILRQDPDIVMVGEIRDLETAETSIQAALTGHLLLSTIHTNDAAGAIPRFLSMGVAAHLLAPAINAIIGQRLVRKLCTCKERVTLSPEMLALVTRHLSSLPAASGETAPDLASCTWYGPKGCVTCNNTGYKGRIGTYEVLLKDDTLEQAILKKSGGLSEYDMRALAQTQGMVTMAQDGILKAIDGMTSLDEIQRVVGF